MKENRNFDFNGAFEQMMESHNLDTVIILGHMNPDGDAAGSVMGLAHYIHGVYPQYRVMPYLAETLDKGPKKLVMSDQVFHPFVKPAEQRWGVIVCDTATVARIIGRELYENAVFSMVIDHHASDEGYGDLNWTQVSEACAENIYYMLDWNRWRAAAAKSQSQEALYPNAADYIYLGIVHDTGSFARAEASTFQAAIDLRDMGAAHREIMKTMHAETFSDMMRRAELFRLVRREIDDTVAYVTVNQEQIREMGISYEDIHPVGSLLRDCEDIELGFTMYEEEPGVWRCSFRSDGKWVDVNELMAPFGGGGHVGAAGLRKRTDNVEELRNQILERIRLMRAGKA